MTCEDGDLLYIGILRDLLKVNMIPKCEFCKVFAILFCYFLTIFNPVENIFMNQYAVRPKYDSN